MITTVVVLCIAAIGETGHAISQATVSSLTDRITSRFQQEVYLPPYRQINWDSPRYNLWPRFT